MTDDFPPFAGLPAQPDYASLSDEWSIPKLVMQAWTDGSSEDRRTIDRSLERKRREQAASQNGVFRFD